MFGAYAKAAGIDASKVTWVIAGSDALPGMLSLGRVDGIGQYTVGEPLLKKAAAPKDIVQLAYSDVGLDYYGSGIVAMESTLQTNPDMVKRFIAATLRGLKDAMANPKEAGEIMHKYHRQVDEGVARDETVKVGQLATFPARRSAQSIHASATHYRYRRWRLHAQEPCQAGRHLRPGLRTEVTRLR